jgi:hypothetical protein
MEIIYLNATQLLEYRGLVEAHISTLLKQARSSSTLEDIKRLILNESPATVRADYFADLLAMFDTPLSTIDVHASAAALQEAWNYFPHRSLNGRCPAEIMMENTDEIRW